MVRVQVEQVGSIVGWCGFREPFYWVKVGIDVRYGQLVL
jgi:hypothetical protein